MQARPAALVAALTVTSLFALAAPPAAAKDPAAATVTPASPARLAEVKRARALFVLAGEDGLLTVDATGKGPQPIRRSVTDGAPWGTPAAVKGPPLLPAPAATTADGKRVALAGATGGVVVVDAASGAIVGGVTPPGNGHAQAVALSADGALLAAGGSKVVVAKVAERAKPVVLAEPNLAFKLPVALAFSPDAAALLVARRVVPKNDGHAARIYDATTGALRHELQTPLDIGGVNAAAFSPDGKRVAVVGSDGVAAFDAETGKPLGGALSAGAWQRVAFAPDGSWFAAYGHGVPDVTGGPQAPLVGLFDAATGQPRAVLRDTFDDIRGAQSIGLGVTRDGRRVISAVQLTTGESVVRAWDVEKTAAAR